MLSTMASPRPWPSVASSRRTPRRAMRSRSSGEQPGPSSSTVSTSAVAVAHRDEHARARPLAGVVEQVAAQLQEIFPVTAEPRAGVDAAGDVEVALAIELAQRLPPALRFPSRGRPACPSRAPAGDAGAPQFAVDAAAQDLQLLRHLPGRARGRAGTDRRRPCACSTVSGVFSACARLPSDSRERCSRRVEQRQQPIDLAAPAAAPRPARARRAGRSRRARGGSRRPCTRRKGAERQAHDRRPAARPAART